eukprot:SAG22_NODE_376_length_11537_cov_29.420353_5_plen_399_part_00
MNNTAIPATPSTGGDPELVGGWGNVVLVGGMSSFFTGWIVFLLSKKEGMNQRSFFMAETLDGVLDVCAFALTMAEGDLEFSNDEHKVIQWVLGATTALSAFAVFAELYVQRVDRERLQTHLKLLYCVHLSGEDVFQAVIYAYVGASQARAGAPVTAPVIACVQASAFTCFKVYELLWPEADAPVGNTIEVEMNNQVPEVPRQVPEVHRQDPEVHRQVPEVPRQVPEVHRQVPEVHRQVPDVHRQVPEVHRQPRLVVPARVRSSAPQPEPEPTWTPSQLHTIQCIEKETKKKWGDPALTSLTRLWIDNNQIADIAPLSALTSLTSLQLGGNQITDIAPLSSLTSLTILNLQSNQITDITPLSALTSLTSLGLRNNPGKFSNSDETVVLLKSRGCRVYFQ